MSDNLNLDNNGGTEGISFDTDSYKAVKVYSETNTPKMVTAVIKLSGGAIKNQRQAEYFLLAIVCIIFLISIVLIYNSTTTQSAHPITPTDGGLGTNQP